MKSTPRILSGLICLALTLLGSPAWADGIVFAKAVPTTTPDQRAMLQFSDGIERLVIETSFVGSGSNFAWVVPLPSTPKVEAVSTNFFAYLNLAYQPKLIRETEGWGFLFLLASYPIATGIWAWRRKGFSGMLLWLGLNGLLFFCLCVIIPNFVVAGVVASAPASSVSVEVRDRQQVGIYDTATLAGTNGAGLVTWLNANGFTTPPAALPIIASYAAQGWVFVAATIHRHDQTDKGTQPHPLAFTFKTEKPVYPLRLTSVENPGCKIELFVFGPGRVAIPDFHVQYCGKPTAVEVSTDESSEGWRMQMDLFGGLYPGDYKIGNEELRRWVFPAAVTTKLAGTLTPQDMQVDAWPVWVPFEPTYPVVYSRLAANLRACDWACRIAIPGLLTLQILSPRLRRKTMIQGCLAVMLLGVVGGWICYAATESTKVVYGGGPFQAQHNFDVLEACLECEISNWTNGAAITDEKLLAILNKDFHLTYGVQNPFTGQPLRCEPTAGNIMLQPSTNGVDVIWYDFHAIPHQLGAFRSK